MTRPFIAGIVGLLALRLTIPACADAASDLARRELRERAQETFARRERAREGAGIPLPALRRDLRALGDSLAAAGLDSLAAEAFYKSAGVGTRILPREGVEEDLRRSVQLAVRARDAGVEVEAVCLLADVMSNRNPEAGRLYLTAQLPRIRRAGNPTNLAVAYSSLARSCAILERWSEAMRYARLAVETSARTGATHSHSHALTQLSQLLVVAGRPQEGLAMADSAERVARRGRRELQRSRALVARSSALAKLGRLDESLAALRQSIAADLERGDRSHEQSARLILANRLLDARRPLAALDQLDTLESRTGSALDLSTEARLVSYRSLAFERLGRHRELDTLIARRESLLESRGTDFQEEEDRAGFNSMLARLQVVGVSSLLARGQYEPAFDLQSRARARLLDAELGARQVSLVELQRALGARGAALLAMEAAPGVRGIVFLLTSDSLRVRRFDVDSVLAEAGVFRAGMFAVGGSAAGAAAGRSLARRLLGDEFARETERAARLVVLPMSEAPDLPIEALPMPGREGATLGTRFALHHSASAASWVALHDRSAAGGGVVAFADPDLGASGCALALFAGSAASTLRQRLTHARDEARAAAGRNGRVYAGTAATGARFRSEAPHAAVLHAAVHGVVLPEDPRRSALVLRDPDGLVGASEIAGLGLSADLVTLSACHGDRGPAYAGEGSLGLARAFIVAGARSVLAARWEVGDRAAARLMGAFYGALGRGHARDESLRQARVTAIAEGMPVRDVYAFVLHGAGSDPVPARIEPVAGR